jgi:hypothetical protein
MAPARALKQRAPVVGSTGCWRPRPSGGIRHLAEAHESRTGEARFPLRREMIDADQAHVGRRRATRGDTGVMKG